MSIVYSIINIEQHPLITGHQWNRLRRGEVRQLTYRTVIQNPYAYDPSTNERLLPRKIVITKKDHPMHSADYEVARRLSKYMGISQRRTCRENR